MSTKPFGQSQRPDLQPANSGEANERGRRNRQGQWQRGASGNPMGRPPGLRNKLTLLREKFAEARAEDILNMLVGHAFNHPAAAIFLAKRLFPANDWAA